MKYVYKNVLLVNGLTSLRRYFSVIIKKEAEEDKIMFIMLCNFKLKPGTRTGLLEELKKHNLEAHLRQQPGNIEYSYLIPPEEENVLRLLEIWVDKESFDAHKNCEETALWRKLNAGLIIGKDNHGYCVTE